MNVSPSIPKCTEKKKKKKSEPSQQRFFFGCLDQSEVGLIVLDNMTTEMSGVCIMNMDS